MRSNVPCALAAVLAVVACSFTHARYGVQHHVEALAGSQAVACGIYQRGGFGEERRLSPEEAAAVSQCMTSALRLGKSSYFYVAGSGIDSQLAWGLVSAPGHTERFEYDSAPCGGPGCKERFETTVCRQPTPGNVDINACANTGAKEP